MVIKILKNAVNFEGIDYSERKEEGKSKLLAALNFDGMMLDTSEAKKSDYTRYMEAVGNLNSSVTYKQFHAVLSTKGNEHSFEQLKEYAIAYLKEMGYGENPSLIYAHSDTKNNHVHMVSTRVDKTGKKVNDSFEKIRSQDVVQKLVVHDPKIELDNALEDALSYNFSTIPQYKLLLELNGFSVKELENNLQLIKYGRVQGEFNNQVIKSKVEGYEPDESRVKQLRALFYKYRQGENLKDFSHLMKDKFGVDVVFHQKEGFDTPYGYTVVDHSQHNVFKGSEILSLKKLTAPLSEADKLQQNRDLLRAKLSEGATTEQLQEELIKSGVLKATSSTELFKSTLHRALTSTQLKKLEYNDRVAAANQYRFEGDKERKGLAQIYRVKATDIEGLGVNVGYDAQRFVNEINSAYSPDEYMERHQLRIVALGQDDFLVDDRHSTISHIAKEADQIEKYQWEAGDFQERGLVAKILDLMADVDYTTKPEHRRRKRTNS